MPTYPYDNAWYRFRAGKLSREPLCKWCEDKGLLTAASAVHHIKPVVEYPSLRLSDSNTVSLCKRCHDSEGAISDNKLRARLNPKCDADGNPIGEHHWNTDPSRKPP